ncbi:cyclic nucleotide-binding domain-containing protein [Gemmobacter denitrificans]|uniref:Cyclic nucleotide-binding domain-containing protein n=1 Tax=Gemmobacter denitrificans TaxID=3123040 RepID=A0ABU8BTQ2_9RHOB
MSDEAPQMLLNDEVRCLRQVPMFAGVAASRLKLLAFASERVAYRKGETLFRQGEPGDAAYLVLEGTADVLIETESGQVKVSEVVRNGIVGEIAILCDVARTATVRAGSDLEALRIDKDDFLRLLHDFPDVTREVVQVLASRLSHTTAELASAHRAARAS